MAKWRNDGYGSRGRYGNYGNYGRGSRNYGYGRGYGYNQGYGCNSDYGYNQGYRKPGLFSRLFHRRNYGNYQNYQQDYGSPYNDSGYGTYYGNEEDQGPTKTSKILAGISSLAAKPKKAASKKEPSQKSSNVEWADSIIEDDYVTSSIEIREAQGA